jgi:hypothetical protein
MVETDIASVFVEGTKVGHRDLIKNTKGKKYTLKKPLKTPDFEEI